MRLDDLMQVARRQVQDGIPADNRAEAEEIISRLNAQQKPLCPTPTPRPRRRRPPRRPGARPTPTRAPSSTPATPTAPDPAGTEAPVDEGCRLP